MEEMTTIKVTKKTRDRLKSAREKRNSWSYGSVESIDSLLNRWLNEKSIPSPE